MTVDDEAGGADDNEWTARLRRRAEQLRGDGDAPIEDPSEDTPTDGAPTDDTPTDDTPTDDTPTEDTPTDGDHVDETLATGTIGGVDDPDLSELIRSWETEAHVESAHPHRNWSPLIAIVTVVVLVALVALAFGVVLADDGTDEADGGPSGSSGGARSILAEDPPSLDELTSEVTIPPGPAEGLSVADKGVTIVEDRFDPARREGTFAVIIENPHTDWIAQGVQVDVEFLDGAGNPVGGDNGFIEVVLPDQKVAVAALFFDAPTAPVADLAVELDVARWVETEPVDGAVNHVEAATEEAEFSGVRTTFKLRSSFPDDLVDIAVTVVYRGADLKIVGGSDTFVDLLEPGVDTPVEVSMLANIPLEQVAITEIYPSVGFDFIPD